MEDKMEEKKEKGEECDCMRCRMHNMMHGKMGCGCHRHSILRIVLLVIIIGIVISAVMHIGAWGFGSRYMRGGCNWGATPVYNRQGMMPGGYYYGNNAQQSSTTPY